jgi:hypothetical protein
VPESVVTGNVTEWIVAYPDVTLRRDITPGPIAVRNIFRDDGGTPEIPVIGVDPFAVVVQIAHADWRIGGVVRQNRHVFGTDGKGTGSLAVPLIEGIFIGSIEGCGLGGRISRVDVDAFAAAYAEGAPFGICECGSAPANRNGGRSFFQNIDAYLGILVNQYVSHGSFESHFSVTATHALNVKRTLPSLEDRSGRCLDDFHARSIRKTNERTAGEFQFEDAFFIGPNLVAGHHE